MSPGSRQVRGLVQFIAEHRIPELLIVGVTVTALGLGLVLTGMPTRISSLPSFSAISVAPLWLWGTAFVATGTASAVLATTSRAKAVIPLAALSVVYLLFAITFAVSAMTGGSPTGFFAYIGLGWSTLATALACTVPRVPRST